MWIKTGSINYSMDTTIHVCLGICHAVISDNQYKKGVIVCGNATCDKKGKPFVIGQKCKQCIITYEEGTVHTCNSEI